MFLKTRIAIQKYVNCPLAKAGAVQSALKSQAVRSMSTKHLLNPEIIAISEVPAGDINAKSLQMARGQRQMPLGDPAAVGVARSEVTFPCADGHEVRALLYVPNRSDTRPGYLHIHGGGYVLGAPEGSDATNLNIASQLGAVVLSVDYRLAPENPIPAPLEDCYAGLAWLHQNADDLNIDRERIGVGGESAGGGLAAAIAIAARDRGEYALCHQHLTYPMLDNLTGTDAQPGDPLVGEFVWTRGSNQFGWASYLGDAPAEAPQVPARVEDFAGLPATWMMTASLDLFRDENIDYARSLLAAGVKTELAVYEGACHGFQSIPNTQLLRRYIRDHLEALAKGLGVAIPA